MVMVQIKAAIGALARRYSLPARGRGYRRAIGMNGSIKLQKTFIPLAFVFFTFLIFAAPIHAAAPAEQLRQIERQLQDKHAEAAHAAEAARKAQQDLSELQQQLRAAAAAEAEQQEAANDLNAGMERLSSQAAAQRAGLAAAGQSESRALGVMLRLAHMPPSVWWLYDGASLDQERRMLLLRTAIRGMGVRAGQLRRQLQAVDQGQEQLQAKQQQVMQAAAVLRRKRDGLNGLIARRQDFVVSSLVEREALLRDAKRLAASAADLHALLDKVARRKPRSPPPPQRQSVLPQGAATPPQGAATMVMPVAGRVKQGFGARDAFGVVSRGATLTSMPDSRIVAPWAGKVVFAGPFKGYGNILILEHQGDYHSLLAGFGRIDVEVGQTVTGGEPVGVLAQPESGGEQAALYFELRRDGNPVNPLLVAAARKQS